MIIVALGPRPMFSHDRRCASDVLPLRQSERSSPVAQAWISAM